MAAARKWVYYFGAGKAEGRIDQKAELGGKGAGLAEMTRIGLPVPCGFTITTTACAHFAKHDKWPPGLEREVRSHIAKMERACNKKLGDSKNPLLVSVRSGAAVSMPGMMETILNLGLNDASVEGLAQRSGNARFAFDSFRRFIMMYGATAKGIDKEHFEEAFDEIKETRTRNRLRRGAGEKIVDTDVDADELRDLVSRFKEIYRQRCGEAFPEDPFEQLRGAINAVFGSWMADKAVKYRQVERITGLPGTAVNVCQMVFGNMGDDCATGVCFTRDPSTGANEYYGDLLINAQGEDVVAGVRTPRRLADLEAIMPEAYDQLEAVRIMLEVHYRDMQDLEFTIESHKLYMLQCRSGKRSPNAAFTIAVDQATRGLVTPGVARRLAQKKYLPKRYVAAASKPVITKDEAITRIAPNDIERLFFPVLDPKMSRADLDKRKLGAGIGAVPGAACGEIVFSAERAETRANEGHSVILVRKETSPEDVGGMHVAAGILTATGGKTSHAAVVARGWGKCCIVGCDLLQVDYNANTLALNGRTLSEGDLITLDGSSGDIFDGRIEMTRPDAPTEYHTILNWCDKRRRLGVRTNADTPADAQRAVEMGAEGIGLCRTEHMFFDSAEPQRLSAMREMILAGDERGRRRALGKLLKFQRKDFEGLFTAMDGKPVTVRLLDPPLHEFLPHNDNPAGQEAVADELNTEIHKKLAGVADWDRDLRARLEAQLVSVEDVQHRVAQLHETNPMLGHRGCRLCITFPEILEMQVRAIIEAAIHCVQAGVKVLPEIMIPLTIDPKEFSILAARTRKVADAILAERKSKLKYSVGTMIETPRAALLADRIAIDADFFSFGTNDLTQMTMALSRDDAGRFLPDYVDQDKAGIFDADPFQSLDVEGVGLLVKMAVQKARAVKPKMKIGICGEHGGDPASIRFCHEVGLDYVSCSPFRVPIARLAAAQTVIETATATRAPKVKAKIASKAKTTAKRTTSVKKSKTTKRTSTRASKVKAEPSKKTAPKVKAKTRGKSKSAKTKRRR